MYVTQSSDLPSKVRLPLEELKEVGGSTCLQNGNVNWRWQCCLVVKVLPWAHCWACVLVLPLSGRVVHPCRAPFEVDAGFSITTPSLHREGKRYREVERLAQGCSAKIWQHQIQTRGSWPGRGFMCLTTRLPCPSAWREQQPCTCVAVTVCYVQRHARGRAGPPVLPPLSLRHCGV